MTNHPPGISQINSDDLLWQQLKLVPAFRALLRATEARFYQKLDLPQPILDIGCGDGRFAKTAFDHPIQVGLDNKSEALHSAENAGSIRIILTSSGKRSAIS